MITNALIAILTAFMKIILFPVTLLSDVVLDSNIQAALDDAADTLDIVGTVVPVPTILAVTGFYIAVETAILLWKGVNWAVRKIPTVN